MTSPWFKADAEDWGASREELIGLGIKWPQSLMRLDLRWWEDQQRMGRRKRPSSRVLAQHWGVSHWQARQALKSGWELEAPHSSHTAPAQAPHAGRTVDGDEQGVFAEAPHTSRTPAAHQPHKNRPTRVLTEDRRQKTEKQDASHPPAPAGPDPQSSKQTTLVEASTVPDAPGEPETLPLWEQMDLPRPGKGCPVKLLTRDVLDVWAYWQKVHTEAGHGKARVLGKHDVGAIHAALQWEPTSADECPEGWTVKRLLCTVLAYAYRAPTGSPNVDFWRKSDRRGSDLNPETLLRLGRDPKLPRNAKWAVAWSLTQRSPTLTVHPGGKGPQTGSTAREIAERLWGEYLTADFENMGFRVQKHGIPPELFRSWADMTIQVVSMQALLHMRPSDQPFRKREYVAACEKWVRANLGAA